MSDEIKSYPGDAMIPYCEVCEKRHFRGTRCPKGETEGDMAHRLLKNKVVKAHWDSLSEDRRIRHIECILHQTPPESRKFDYARWWSEQIIDLVDNGVIREEE